MHINTNDIMILLYIRNSIGELTPMEINHDKSVRDILNHFEDRHYISYQNTILNKDDKLSDTGISNESVIDITKCHTMYDYIKEKYSEPKWRYNESDTINNDIYDFKYDTFDFKFDPIVLGNSIEFILIGKWTDRAEYIHHVCIDCFMNRNIDYNVINLGETVLVRPAGKYSGLCYEELECYACKKLEKNLYRCSFDL